MCKRLYWQYTSVDESVPIQASYKRLQRILLQPHVLPIMPLRRKQKHWTQRQQQMWRVRTESSTSFQDPWSRSRKWLQELLLCLNSEGLARDPCSKMILEDVIQKLAEYFKVKMRINMLKLCRTARCILQISALFSCNTCIVCLLNCCDTLW